MIVLVKTPSMVAYAIVSKIDRFTLDARGMGRYSRLR